MGRIAQRIANAAMPLWVFVGAGCNQSSAGLGFGGMLAKTMLLLALVIGLAVFTLRLAARAGIGVGRPSSGKMQLLDELVIGPRESIVAISAGSKVLVASRTQAGLAPLATLTQADWNGRGFAEVLAEVASETAACSNSVDSVDSTELVA